MYINNKEYKIVGNICMDMLFVKVDDSVNVGDKVTIIKDISHIKELTHNNANITIGSALDLFGGKLEFDKVLELIKH